jgi:hypothetical protein
MIGGWIRSASSRPHAPPRVSKVAVPVDVRAMVSDPRCDTGRFDAPRAR